MNTSVQTGEFECINVFLICYTTCMHPLCPNAAVIQFQVFWSITQKTSITGALLKHWHFKTSTSEIKCIHVFKICNIILMFCFALLSRTFGFWSHGCAGLCNKCFPVNYYEAKSTQLLWVLSCALHSNFAMNALLSAWQDGQKIIMYIFVS